MRNKAASRLDAGAMRRVFRRFHADVVAHEQLINDLNVFPVPDGDTGTNSALTIAAGLPAADKGRQTLPDLLEVVAGALALGARGNSGVILAEYLRGWVSLNQAEWDSSGLHQALQAGAVSAQSAVMVPREGTMLTIAQAVVDVPVVEQLSDYALDISNRARSALAETTEQLDVLKAAGVVDSGAMVLVLLFDAIASELNGRALPEIPIERRACDVSALQYRGTAYEVMFTFEGDKRSCDSLREELALLGDSVTVTGVGSYRVHVHVEHPADAIAEGQRHGRVHSINISRLTAMNDVQTNRSFEGLAVVVATSVPGVAPLIRDAGAICLFTSERAAPSTIEFVDAALSSGCSHVLLLPSDVDAHASAALAAHHLNVNGVQAHVIGTRSVVESLAALAVHTTDATFDSAVASLTDAATSVRSAYVTQAERDVMTSAGMCHTGDVLGLIDGVLTLISAIATSDDMCVALVDRLLDHGGEIVTLIVGETGNASVAKRILADHPGVDVVVVEGNQSTSAYLIGVE